MHLSKWEAMSHKQVLQALLNNLVSFSDSMSFCEDNLIVQLVTKDVSKTEHVKLLGSEVLYEQKDRRYGISAEYSHPIDFVAVEVFLNK